MPRPTDAELLAKVMAERPDGQVGSLDFKDSPRGTGRIGCGIMQINGMVEPVAVIAGWQEPSRRVIAAIGVPPPPQTARWESRVIGATRADHDGDGEITRYDRNNDTLDRQMALMVCRQLTPPPGTVWVTELERNPDPERADRARRLAEASADLLFGAPSGAAQRNP